MTNEMARSITRNTSVMMLSQMVTWTSSFVLMMFLPRYLGSEDYGRLYLAISLTAIFEVIINFGGQYHITKEISRSRQEASFILMNSLVLRGVIWVISIAMMIVISIIAGYPPLVRNLIVILGLAKLWESASWVMRWCFQGFERMGYPSVGGLLERLLLTGVGVVALLLGANSFVIAIVMAVSTLVNCLFLLSSIRKIIPSVPQANMLAIKKQLRESVPYFLWSAFAVIYFRIDAVMLSLMTPETVVGWYGAAYRFFDILMFLPSIYTTAVFPIISRLWKDSVATLALTTQKSLEFVLVAGIPITIIMFGFATDIIQFFFGLQDYTGSVDLLRVLSVGILLVYVDFVLGTTVLAEDKQRQWSIVAFLAIPLNVILNYVLIPYFQQSYGNGGIGAAIGTIVTEAFIMGAALVLLTKKTLMMPRMTLLAKSLVSAVLMSVFIFFVQSFEIFWMISVCGALMVYLGVFVSMRPLAKDEMEVLFDVVSFNSIKRFLNQRRVKRV